ncbi:Hpt domain-containing protein [Geoalkalibacter sp.]|uniref:Hpt domain-containing protein n=1 Tax=Geoalkalibacter sp. TaxID=3041440 RepID=UPI00272E11DA|nr:Hpt domain-containing protein [Geoalkalibacter sp.]
MPDDVNIPADLSDLLEDLAGQEGAIKDLINQFNQDAPRYLAQLREAVEKDDARGLEQVAHRLKSLLGIFQAMNAYGMAERLEDCGRSNCWNEVRNLVDEFDAELARVRDYLAGFL